MNARPSTLIELLRERARQAPQRVAFRFLTDGEREELVVTYEELDRRARAIGAALGENGAKEQRVVLLYPPSLDFISGFFGCLYAGAIPVPTYPPQRGQGHRSHSRFQSIVRDSEPALALTTEKVRERLAPHAALMPRVSALRWLASDGVGDELADEWRDPEVEPTALALLQYTSGSTSEPKGVAVTHANILANERLICEAFELSDRSRIVGWLPFHHDMGLIGNVFQPLYLGCESVLMSPLAFLRRPVRWLEAISTYRGTTSGGPSFAYDLCVRRVTAEQSENLDLSSWTLAFNGAEPVRAEVVDSFVARFEPHGFRRQAMFPCYGLAEATLFVSGGAASESPATRTVEAAQLEANHVEGEVDGSADGQELVSSGWTRHGQRMAIVDPQTSAECSSGSVGEIWLAGESIAAGYWNRPEETAQTFEARLEGDQEGRYLRTGDLGFVLEDELFVTGRLKDLILIRGKNHYPQDIEWSLEQSHPSLRWNSTAAFSVDLEGQERLVVMAELESRYQPKKGTDSLDLEAVVDVLRQRVASDHGLMPHAVVLLKAGEIPRTTSGKIQRHACRAGYLDGGFEVVLNSALDLEKTPAPAEGLTEDALEATPLDERQQALLDELVRQVAAVLRRPREEIRVDQPLTALGVDSLVATELSHELETRLGVSIPMTTLLAGPSLLELANRPTDESVEARDMPELEPVGLESERPLSSGQEALWFLQRLTPEETPYNVAAAARIQGELNLEALRRALERLSARHPSLRTTFAELDGRPRQSTEAVLPPGLEVFDAAGWSSETVETQLVEEAYRPFDLETGPPLRVSVLRRSADEILAVLSVHHIVADFWSLAIYLDELGRLYAAERVGKELELEPLGFRYADYVAWQQRMLSSEAGERHWRYWKRQLAGTLPQLDLPFDRPLPAVQTYRGASQSFSVDAELTRELEALGRGAGATLFMTLLAAYQVLLHRYSGQETVLVGSPTSGRRHSELAGTMGYYVNPVVLRGDLGADPSFEDFLRATRDTVIGAFEHQDFPFPLLVERLQPVRDASRSPLFQAMFVLQKAQTLASQGLSEFALGEAGAELDLWGLRLESLPLVERRAPFDLTLKMAEGRGGLEGSLEFNSDLFEPATIARMVEQFTTLLASIAKVPQSPVSKLSLLLPEARHRLLSEWNATELAYPRTSTVHEAFEQQVDQTPEAVAVVFEEDEVTFRELNSRADRLAGYLRSRGVGAGDLVGVYLERSSAMVVALLGVLKAGAAYVPLDPEYPSQRVRFMIEDSRARVVLTESGLRRTLSDVRAEILDLDSDWASFAAAASREAGRECDAEDPAYVIYTSGSTGTPKGVVIPHRAVANFFAGMDQRIGCGPDDTLLAVTSISFDISVLELLWTLTRGARVVLLSEGAASGVTLSTAVRGSSEALGFGLFYFGNVDPARELDRYHLFLEGARFADRNGFDAVWTPERHFHAFGGLYPQPAVTGAAAAAITERVQIRAGSVVLPLHDPIRVAEEWSVVDNLSNGRVGVSFASGWHSDDFVLAPDNYEDRKTLMYTGIETVRSLWRGEPVAVRNGSGDEVEVRVYPRPIQDQLPIWVTAAGSPDTFAKAGEIGANVLTHLLGQRVEDVAERIEVYRESLARHGHDPSAGRVSLMLHAFVGDSLDSVRETVREPLTEYLRTSVGLVANLMKGVDPTFDVETIDEKEMDDLLEFAFDRYFETSGLFGTPETCLAMLDRCRAIGVDEIACLIDFGVEEQVVLDHLVHLDALRRAGSRQASAVEHSLAVQAKRYGATLLQCTPSLMKMLALNEETLDSLQTLRVLMLGGEALPEPLVRQLDETLSCRIVNMYGPTETTIWSTTWEVDLAAGGVPIGKPIANTQVYVLDASLEPVPVGLAGNLYIGGDGLATGYLRRPELTERAFVPDPFSDRDGARLYRTGDLARYRPDGMLEFLGREDQQAKIRGFRVEPGEIEALLGRHEMVDEAAVLVREGAGGDAELLGYVVAAVGAEPGLVELREFLGETLPNFMVPSRFVTLESMPLTPNGKLDRKALAAIEGHQARAADFVAPAGALEETIAEVWREALQVERVGVHDNFFDLGGHSLLMAQVHSRLKSQLERDLPLIKLLEHPTVSSMARYLGGEDAPRGDQEATVDRARKQRAGLRRQSRLRGRHSLARGKASA